MSTATHILALPTGTWAESSHAAVEGVDVHKTRDSAVLLETWRCDGRDRFVTTSQWPATHPHFGAVVDGMPPLALAAESLRQCVILVSHRGYAVPRDSAFVMRSLSVSLLEQVDADAFSTSVTLSVQCDKTRRQGRALRGMEAAVEFRVDGEIIGFGHGNLSVLPANVYARVRGYRPALEHRTRGPRLSPATVGVTRSSDVLLGERGDGSLALHLDTTHLHHFDHPADHIPGMTLIEAALQAHTLRLRDSVPIELNADFSRYAELIPPVTVERKQSDVHATTTTFQQDGIDVASVRVGGQL